MFFPPYLAPHAIISLQAVAAAEYQERRKIKWINHN
nr:MAG TPA: hypothetical protein [Caudoviricetes sp.]